MLQATIIGHLGGDAEVKNADGREFMTFRVAHTDRWTDAQGVQHDTTQWVDCILNGRPNVLPYLKRGTHVFIMGRLSARVYSSAKDKCFKAGITINVSTLELLGGKSDLVPSKLYDEHGVEVPVTKYFWVDNQTAHHTVLISQSGQQYVVTDDGWVAPVQTPTAQQSQTETDDAPFTDYSGGEPQQSETSKLKS